MAFDPPSFFMGLTVAAAIGCAWYFGQQSAIRTCRRITRHGRNLDYVFFEDAERDVTIKRPEPATADVRDFHRESQR